MLDFDGLDHVVIRARDPNRLIQFYRDVLGCSLERQSAPELGLYQLRAGRSLIDLVAVEGKLGREGGAAPGAGDNMDHFCLRVNHFDPDRIIAHLARHGVEADPPTTRYGADGWGPSIYLRDPEGNRLELKGPPEREPESEPPR